MKKVTKDLVFNPVLRSNEVKRYSGVRMQEEESLSQHIFEVSALSYMIANKLNTFGENLNIEDVLKKCLLHDFDEIVTGDVQRNVKYASPAIKMAMDNVANHGISSLQSKYNDLLGTDFYDTWSKAKQGKSGFVIKLADMLVVARKAMIEVKIYNNYSALKVVSELVDHLQNLTTSFEEFKEYKDESKKYLLNIIDDISSSINEIKHNNNKDIIDFNLDATVIENSPKLDK